MPTNTHDIVAKLWNLCNVLKDDGVTYHQYVTELTYLLFLKMAKETGREEGIPAEWRWGVLDTLQGLSQFNHYKELLLKLGSSSQTNEGPDEEESEEEGNEASPASPIVTEIYANASTFIKKPVMLKKLVDEIDKIDWYSARQEGLGDLYEGAAAEKRRREEIRGRSVLHPPAADRFDGGDDAAAAGGRDPGSGGWHRWFSDCGPALDS